jgi:hypothetical protein
MYDWDDVLIVGDSWCAERDKFQYWPNYLLFELTEISKGIPRGKGYPGCSWWSTRKKLFDELNNRPAKVIIIVHTDPNRIPSDQDLPMTVNMAFRTVTVKGRWETQKKELRARAAAEYYSHLYSANFHTWAEQKWFEELDSFLIDHKNSKIIHLYGHRTNIDNQYKFNMGVTVEPHLYQYYAHNTQNIAYPNHMSIEHNEKLALSLKNIILNYPGHGYVHKERLFNK